VSRFVWANCRSVDMALDFVAAEYSDGVQFCAISSAARRLLWRKTSQGRDCGVARGIQAVFRVNRAADASGDEELVFLNLIRRAQGVQIRAELPALTL
jgi:hypothetical protein